MVNQLMKSLFGTLLTSLLCVIQTDIAQYTAHTLQHDIVCINGKHHGSFVPHAEVTRLWRWHALKSALLGYTAVLDPD